MKDNVGYCIARKTLALFEEEPKEPELQTLKQNLLVVKVLPKNADSSKEIETCQRLVSANGDTIASRIPAFVDQGSGESELWFVSNGVFPSLGLKDLGKELTKLSNTAFRSFVAHLFLESMDILEVMDQLQFAHNDLKYNLLIDLSTTRKRDRYPEIWVIDFGETVDHNADGFVDARNRDLTDFLGVVLEIADQEQFANPTSASTIGYDAHKHWKFLHEMLQNQEGNIGRTITLSEIRKNFCPLAASIRGDGLSGLVQTEALKEVNDTLDEIAKSANEESNTAKRTTPRIRDRVLLDLWTLEVGSRRGQMRLLQGIIVTGMTFALANILQHNGM